MTFLTLYQEGHEINSLTICSDGKFYSNGKEHYNHKGASLKSNRRKERSTGAELQIIHCKEKSDYPRKRAG